MFEGEGSHAAKQRSDAGEEALMTIEAPELTRWNARHELPEETQSAPVDPTRANSAVRHHAAGHSEDHQSASTLKSVGTALDLLACFSHDAELGVSDVARRLGVAKSTAHRLLATLRSRGLVERNPLTGQYRLGLRLIELGNLARDRHPVRNAAISQLVELRRATGLPVRVGVPDGGDLVHVDHFSAALAPPLLEKLPRRLPLHHCADGLVLCAHDQHLASQRVRLGLDLGGTIRTSDQFATTLAKVRGEGVAIMRDSVIQGITTVSAPVLDASGTAYFSVGVIAPTDAVERSTEGVTELVRVSAGRITRAVWPVIADGPLPLLP